uniref:Uncharacterized protein n=1 Tax=Setaria italica TaxID=4555 RepID=K3ZH03_SETIT
MAPAEEQGKEVNEIAPAASEQQQETQERHQMPPAASENKEKEEVAKIDEVLSWLKPLPAKITELLESAGPRRVRDHPERRALEFMKMELTDLVDSLKSMLPPLQDGRVGAELKMDWLNRLILFARDAHSLVKQVSDSRLHTLLRRATQFFRRSNKVLMYMAEESFRAAEYASKYRCLLLASSSSVASGSSDHALPPCSDHLLFGIDRPIKKLLGWLTSQEETEERGLKFIAIVGAAGMGKTTLAMELHRRLQCQASGGYNSFQCNAVAQVSNSTRRMELLLRDILSRISYGTSPLLPSDQSPSKTTELLVYRVREYLQDKRYFILIDDLWHREDWEEIKGAFPNNNLDSRLLITTRVESIAWSCCSDSKGLLVHEMKPLNQMDSERLLLVKAFGSVDGCPSDSMKLFCDKILMTCQGIPLFVTGTADWLKEQLQLQQKQQRYAICSEEQVPQLPELFEQELSSAFDDLPSELPELFGQELSSAFGDLPSELPELFEQELMFPYCYSFEKDHLILKWISECHTSWPEYYVIRKRKEEGNEYFSQLVDRNVISSAAANCKPGLSEDEACQWHINQFMQQFLASKSAKIGFAFTSTTLTGNVTRMPRRLALHHPDPLLPSEIQTKDLSQTRWLTVSGSVSAIPVNMFVNLVVLDLEGWDNFNNQDLEEICRGKMFVLEYLSIRKTRVSKLPHEIKDLQNLMILDVSCTTISVLPSGVFKLKRLYHLDLRGTAIRKLTNEIVGLQSTLHALLVGDEGMINSVEAATWVPHDIQRFHALHTLATIDLTGQAESFIQALGDLHTLRVLAVTWSFHQSTDRACRQALESSIQKLHRLESLTIHCGLGCSMEFLGVSDNCRPWTLEKFKVTAGRFARVPRWIDNYQKLLRFVQITVCRLETDDLKRLGELLQLQFLTLGLDFVPEEAIVIDKAGFSELQRFSVDCQMPWLTFKTGAMRKLRYLQLTFNTCPASSQTQTNVPSGIGSLQSLSEVALCYNARYSTRPSVKATVEAARKQVAENPNQIDLFINGHQDYDVQEADEETENANGTIRRVDAETKCDARAVLEEASRRTTEEYQSEIEAEADARSDS